MPAINSTKAAIATEIVFIDEIREFAI